MLPLLEHHIDDHYSVNIKLIKAKKRQLERVRRQRINEKLEKLKVIVMKRLGNDVGFYPPMEKADILELAIRCLEGKEQTILNEGTSKTDRKPLEPLPNNTPSPKAKNKVETTPIRKTILRATTVTKSEPDENDTKVPTQFRAEFKPLLQHPIRSLSMINVYDDIISKDQSHQSPTKNNDSHRKNPIWRPWTI